MPEGSAQRPVSALKRPRLTMHHLRERDGGRCAYTERVLKPEECSMEHVVTSESITFAATVR
jgi:hypothetical protein